MREVERWVTICGRRIPIFYKGDAIKPLNKKELAKKIYKDAMGYYTLDLPKGYKTSYNEYYIQGKTKKEVLDELNSENGVVPQLIKPEYQKTIKGFKRPEGKPELTAYARDKAGNLKIYTDNDYKSKEDFRRDLKANELYRAHIADKRDLYISKKTDYGNMSQIEKDYKIYKRMYKQYGDRLSKEHMDELKQIIDKANKVYLQKQKKYKFKK